MAFTFNKQDNPVLSVIGKVNTDAIIINNDSAVTHWQVRRKDQDGATMSVVASTTANGTVLSVSTTQLTILLPTRQKYQVRVRSNSVWTAWTDFKMGDKNYGLPAAIRDLETEGEVRVVVTNNARQVETASTTGTQVVNNKKMYNDVASITQTSRGATIVTR